MKTIYSSVDYRHTYIKNNSSDNNKSLGNETAKSEWTKLSAYQYSKAHDVSIIKTSKRVQHKEMDKSKVLPLYRNSFLDEVGFLDNKEVIRRIINHPENPSTLSDDDIVRVMKDNFLVDISREIVAHYRLQLHLESK